MRLALVEVDIGSACRHGCGGEEAAAPYSSRATHQCICSNTSSCRFHLHPLIFGPATGGFLAMSSSGCAERTRAIDIFRGLFPAPTLQHRRRPDALLRREATLCPRVQLLVEQDNGRDAAEKQTHFASRLSGNPVPARTAVLEPWRIASFLIGAM